MFSALFSLMSTARYMHVKAVYTTKPVTKAIFFLFLGLRILLPKFLHFRKKKKNLFLNFFISSDVKNCQI